MSHNNASGQAVNTVWDAVQQVGQAIVLDAIGEPVTLEHVVAAVQHMQQASFSLDDLKLVGHGLSSAVFRNGDGLVVARITVVNPMAKPAMDVSQNPIVLGTLVGPAPIEGTPLQLAVHPQAMPIPAGEEKGQALDLVMQGLQATGFLEHASDDIQIMYLPDPATGNPVQHQGTPLPYVIDPNSFHQGGATATNALRISADSITPASEEWTAAWENGQKQVINALKETTGIGRQTTAPGLVQIVNNQSHRR